MPRGQPPTRPAGRRPLQVKKIKSPGKRMKSPSGRPPRSPPLAANSAHRKGAIAMGVSPSKLLPLSLSRVKSFDSAAKLLKSGLQSVTDEIFPVPGAEGAATHDVNEGGVMEGDAAKPTEQRATAPITSPFSCVTDKFLQLPGADAAAIDVDTGALECDYDADPTELYLLVQHKKWPAAIQRALNYPAEAATWVTRREADGTTLRWRMLPLHAAIVFQAPRNVIAALLSAYPEGAKYRDDQGKLPLHLCFRKDTEEEILSLLLQAYPEGIDEVDDKGRTAMVLASNSPSEKKEGWMRLLEMFSGHEEELEGPFEEEIDVREEPSSPVEVALEDPAPVAAESVSPVHTVDKTPRTKAKASIKAAKPRMDDELVDKLHRRRETLDAEVSETRTPEEPEEESSEVEYTDGADGVAAVVSVPEKDGAANDAPLLQKFRAQRRSQRRSLKSAKRDQPEDVRLSESRDLLRTYIAGTEAAEPEEVLRDAEAGLSSRDDVKEVKQVESRDAAESCGRSIVDLAPPSLREQMRDRLEKRDRQVRQKVTLFQDLHKRDEPPTSAVVAAASSKAESLPVDDRESIHERLSALESDEVSISSSICSSTDGTSVGGNSVKSLKRYFSSLKASDSWTSGLESTSQEGEDTVASRDHLAPAAEWPKMESPSNDVTPVRTNATRPSVRKEVDSPESVEMETRGADDDSILRFIKKMKDEYGDKQPKVGRNSGATDKFDSHPAPKQESKDAGRLSKIDSHGALEKAKLNAWPLEDGPELYASTLMTASTAEMTEVPSRSYEDGSHGEVYASRVNQKDIDLLEEEDLSTPKLMMRFENLRGESFSFSPTADEKPDIDFDDDATLNLMEKAERFLSSDVSAEPVKRDSSTPTSRDDTAGRSYSSSASITQSKFDQLMAKYEVMSQTSLFYESDVGIAAVRRESSTARNDFRERNVAKTYSGVPRGDYFHSTTSRHRNHDVECFNANEPHRGKSEALMVHPSHSGDSQDECFVTIPKTASTDSDAVSTLSRTTAGYTTIGSATFSSEKSAEIESYCTSVVHDIVAKEVGVTGSIKRELQAALRSKKNLERRVKILKQKSDEQSLQLRTARKEKKLEKDKFSREMEIHLTRKASELKSCIEVAMAQAEESKRRAVELAQREMEKEVSLLRSQLDTVRANGVPVDKSLQNALGLVESNQRALREAAEKDAQGAIEMKNEIEQSFVGAVGDFEAWSDRQLAQMERRWRHLR